MKKHIKILLLLLLTSTTAVFAQAGKEKTPALIQSKNYTFYASSAYPQNNAEITKVLQSLPGGSSMINLDPGIYQLTVKKDSLIAFLPYYGRAYSASMDPNDRGIKFTSKDFTYKEVKTKKGGWVIDITTKDVKENYRFTLSVSASGYSSLSVTPTNRSFISFNGYVDEIIEPKKNL